MTITDVIFDCFGTLVQYTPDRREVRMPASYARLVSLGYPLSYADFVNAWDGVSRRLENESRETGRECAMETFVDAFLANHVPGSVPAAEAVEFMVTYVEEWRREVRPEPAAARVVRQLADSYRVSVITNTHYPPLVHDVLAETGVADAFAQVVMSAEVGFRKPHRAIFEAAIQRLSIVPGAAVFVGDSYEDDVLGAAGVGMPAILIDGSGRHRGHAGHRVDRLSEVPALVTAISRG